MATFINTPSGPQQAPTGMPQPTTQTVGGLNTLHYGGSMNMKSGRLSAKPKTGSTYRSRARMETIARLENVGMTEAATAAMFCISKVRLMQIKKSPEYLMVRMQVTHGIIVDNDARLAQIKDQRKEILTQMLPPALQALANELQRPALTIAERRHKASIAQDLLDREGTFAKVSRTEIKPVDAFDFERADSESRKIINAIRSAAPAPTERSAGQDEQGEDVFTTHSEYAVEANEAFSNSHTLSQTDQEKALAKLEEEAAAALIRLPLPSQEIQ